MSDRQALIDAFSDVNFSDWPEVQSFVEGKVADAILSSDWLAAHDAEVTAKSLERGVDELGVYVGDDDGDYWAGYRDGQRRQIHVLKKLAVESRAAAIRTTNNESGDE